MIEFIFQIAPTAVTVGVAAWLVWKLRGRLDHRDDDVKKELTKLKDDIKDEVHKDRLDDVETKAHIKSHDRCFELVRTSIDRLERKVDKLTDICSKE